MANWRVGVNQYQVFDSSGFFVCQCRMPKQAARIVAAANAEEELKLLRELASYAGEVAGQTDYPMRAWLNLRIALAALDALRKERQ